MAVFLRPVPAQEPEIVEVIGVPEIVADGSKIETHDGWVMVVLYRERQRGDTVERIQVGTVHMSVSGYDRTLRRNYGLWAAGAH